MATKLCSRVPGGNQEVLVTKQNSFVICMNETPLVISSFTLDTDVIVALNSTFKKVSSIGMPVPVRLMRGDSISAFFIAPSVYLLLNECSSQLISIVWFVSKKLMNKDMHSLNGNIDVCLFIFVKVYLTIIIVYYMVVLCYRAFDKLFDLLSEASALKVYLYFGIVSNICNVAYDYYYNRDVSLFVLIACQFYGIIWLMDTKVSVLWYISRRLLNKLKHALNGNILNKEEIILIYLSSVDEVFRSIVADCIFVIIILLFMYSYVLVFNYIWNNWNLIAIFKNYLLISCFINLYNTYYNYCNDGVLLIPLAVSAQFYLMYFIVHNNININVIWQLTRRQRNRLMHAMNGNIDCILGKDIWNMDLLGSSTSCYSSEDSSNEDSKLINDLDYTKYISKEDFQQFVMSLSGVNDAQAIIDIFTLLSEVGKRDNDLSNSEANVFLEEILRRNFRRFFIPGISESCLRFDKSYFIIMCREICKTNSVRINCLLDILERKLLTRKFTTLLFKEELRYNRDYVQFFLKNYGYDVSILQILGYSEDLKISLNKKNKNKKKETKNRFNLSKSKYLKMFQNVEFIGKEPIYPNGSLITNCVGFTLYRLNVKYASLHKNYPGGSFYINNSAALLLYGNPRGLSARSIRDLYNKVDLVESTSSYKARNESIIRFSNFIPSKVLHLGIDSYHSVDDFISNTYMSFFKRNKGLYSKCMDYLNGSYNESSQIVIQNLLDRSFERYRPSGKLILQGNIQQGPIASFGLNVTHDIPQLSGLVEVFQKLFEPSSAGSVLLKTIVFIRSMCVETNPIFKALLLMNYCTSLPQVWDIITHYFEKLLLVVGEKLVLQSDGDLEQEIVEATFLTVIGDIFAKFGTLDSGKHILLSFLRETKIHMTKTTGKNFGDKLLNFIVHGFELLKQVINTRDINVLFRNLNPVVWVRDAFLLVSLEPLITNTEQTGKFDEYLKDGELPSMIFTPISIDMYIDIMSVHIEKGEEMLRVFKDDKVLSLELKKKLDDLKSHKALSMNKCVGNKCRACPFAVYIHGPPGVGKTTLSTQLYKAVANRYGYDLENGMYSWRPNVNFQDSFDHTKWCVTCDDIDTGVAPQIATQENHCQIINALVNNAPYQIEQANVDLKGKIFANPALILYTSNTTNGRASQIVRNPEAFFRRFKLRITLEIKPEFLSVNKMLDSEKCENVKHRNYWWIDVYEGSPIPKVEWKLLYQHIEFDQFIKIFWQKMELHRKGEAEFIRSQKIDNFCPICYLPNPLSCNHQDEKDASPFVPKIDNELSGISKLKLQGNLQNKPIIDVDKIVKDRFAEFSGLFFKRIAPFGLIVGALIPVVVYAVRKYTTSDEYDLLVQDRVENATGLPSADWRRMSKVVNPGIPMPNAITWTKDEVLRLSQSASFKIHHDIGNGKVISMFGVVYDAKHVIVNRHLLGVSLGNTNVSEFYGKQFYFEINNSKYIVCLNKDNFRLLPHSDLMVVYVPSLSHTYQIRRFVQVSVDKSINFVDGCMYINKDKIIEFESGQFCKTKFGDELWCTGKMLPLINEREATTEGDCGGIYLFSTDPQCKFWKIGGIHWAMNGTFNCAGAVISSMTIDSIIRDLVNIPQNTEVDLSTFVKPGINPEFKDCNKFSEVLAAKDLLGVNFPTYGTMIPSPSSSTIKFKTQYSLIAKHHLIQEYEEKWCGETNYWRLPLAKIKQAPNKINYDSCYINAFRTLNSVVPDKFLLHLAMIDYLQGITQLDNSGYTVLSNDQVVRGIPGSFIHSVNMTSSIGPPYNCNKRKFVSFDLEGSYIEPNIFESILNLENKLCAGEIVSVCGICVPKDEPNKPNKFTRIFTSLPYSFNFVMKKYGGPFKSFIRSNPEFFESMVGTNMTGLDCNTVVNLLQKVDPSLTNLFDADIKAMDKSWSPDLYEIVAKTIYAISFYLGIDYIANYSIVQSLLHIKYSIQGDLFSTSWNPSGNDWTVELNGILLSICARYIYYKCNKPLITPEQVDNYMKSFFKQPIKVLEGCSYRQFNSLVTYGDDNVQSVKWSIPNTYFDLWQSELGMTVTPADKNKVGVHLVGIEDIQFLKRTFKFNKDFGCYVAALDRKSMIRMLVMKKPSTLSGVDHVAISCSEFLREMFLHGREEFEWWQQQIINLLTSKGWINNNYFINQPYDYWASQFLRGEFYTWVEHDNSTNNLDYKKIILQMNMEISNNQGSSIESSLLENSGTQVAQFVATDPAVVAGNSNTTYNLSKMPPASLDKFLTRPVEVVTEALTNGDAALSVLSTFSPINLMFGNSAVADKIQNFTLYKGTVQVIARIAVPPGTYGLYAICALPMNNVASTDLIAGEIIVENVMQPIHVMIDISQSTEAVLQLPFIYDRDYAPTNVTDLWDVSLVCLQSIATGIQGGFTSGQVKFYVNFLDDYELVIPRYQGKIENNKALKDYAPSIYNLIGQGRGSSTLQVVEDIAASAKGLPIVGSIASSVEMTASVGKKILSYFGFTRDNRQPVPTVITMRSVTNVANCDGIDPSDVSALLKENRISIDPALVGGIQEDEMSFTYLFSKFTLVGVLPWETSDATGTILGVIPVTPMYHRQDASLKRHFTTAGFIGVPFTFWRGSMEYLVVIPVSVFHRGTLQIVWNEVTSITSDPTNVTFNCVYNIASRQNQLLTVDYVKPDPMLPTTIFSDRDAIIPYQAGNGFLSFRVVNPLYSQAEVTTTNVFVFARAGADMEFGKPRETFTTDNGAGTVTPYGIYDNITLQGALGDGPESMNIVSLVKASDSYPVDMMCMGERIESIRALVQKPCKIHEHDIVVNNVGHTRTYPYLYYRPGAPAAGLFAPTTYVGYYLSMYIGVAGSERWKFITSGSNQFLSISRSSSISPFLSYVDPMSFVGVNRGLEYLVPYYLNLKFVTPLLAGTTSNNSRVCSLATVAGSEIPYYCMGPDVRVVGFRQIPSVIFGSTGGTYNPWF
jgi:hypothetical protein